MKKLAFGIEKSAFKDSFARDLLPPSNLWPDLLEPQEKNLQYPSRLNCAVELLDKMVASGLGDKPVIYGDTETWTYGRLLTEANRIAHALVQDCNFTSGNRVLLRGPNSPMLAACWFGVLKAGGICVTTMPLLRQVELGHAIDKAKISLAICDAGLTEELFLVQQQSSQLKTIVTYQGRTPANAKNSTSNTLSLEKLAQGKPESFDACDTAADDIALIAFTSGTTGKAKGTVHFHRDVLYICDIFPTQTLKAQASDIFCGTPHLAFTFGLGGILLFPMRIGASAVLLEKCPPDELLGAIQKHKATVCFSSPTGYRAMAQSASNFDISSLRKCVSAGEVLPAATLELWKKTTGITLIDGLGSTEMLHVFISASESEMKGGFTGKPVPPYEAKVIDKSGNEVPAGTVGLLAVRGPTGCRYLDDKDRQSEYVRSGWNVTGDAYIAEKDGYFSFHARADDMIISSGYNISGNEVENALLAHPKVKECAVIGAPDPERGMIVKAVVVLKDPGEACDNLTKDLQNFVKNQIAPYKYPRMIEFTSQLPRTETGKLQRFRLR